MRRSASVLCTVVVAFATSIGVPTAAADEDTAGTVLARELRNCVRAVRADGRADPFGLVRVQLDVRCPTLWAQLGTAGAAFGGRERLLPGGAATTLRQVEDLTRIAESAVDPAASVRLLPAVRLQRILTALDPAARGELSTRARLARWWRSVVGEFDPRERQQSGPSRRIEWPLGFWSTVSWFAFGTAALLIVTVIIQEIRAALGPRTARRRPVRRRAAAAAPDFDPAIWAALPARQRAGELLRAVAARLHARDALPPPVPLTPREIDRAARVPDPQRAALALITEVAEAGAYGRTPPDEPTLAAAASSAGRWLDAEGRRWTRSVRR